MCNLTPENGGGREKIRRRGKARRLYIRDVGRSAKKKTLRAVPGGGNTRDLKSPGERRGKPGKGELQDYSLALGEEKRKGEDARRWN